MRAISTKAITWVYITIPLIVFAILIDTYAFDGVLRGFLPRRPEQLLWYTLLFNVPHFFASYFSFADKGYLANYKGKLQLGIPLIVLLAFLLPAIDISVAVVYLVLYTMYHNVSQQTGIASIVMKYAGWKVTLWRYLNIVLGLSLYTMVYPSVVTIFARMHAYQILTPLLVGSALLTYLIAQESKTTEGKYYAWGTAGIAGVGTLAYALGYPFFVSTSLRIVHDLTAFTFYIVHDQNRNREVFHNYIYRYLMPNTSFFVVGIPALAIALTYLVQGGGTSMPIQAFFFLAVTHFFIEGFMWKNGSPHRSNLAFQYGPNGII